MSAEGVWPVNIYLTFASSAAYDKLGQITKDQSYKWKPNVSEMSSVSR